MDGKITFAMSERTGSNNMKMRCKHWVERCVICDNKDAVGASDSMAHVSRAEFIKNRAAEIAEAEEKMAVVEGKGGEVSTACPPEDKDKAFWNGYWTAAHNIAHDIRDMPIDG